MKTREINGSIICYDGYNLDNKPELINFLETEKLSKFIDSIGEKAIIVLGGDGTMLRAIKENYKKQLPFLGINFGSTGFLLNHKSYLNNAKFIKREYPLLEIKNGSKNIGITFNDISVYSPIEHILDLEVTVNKESKICFRGDGLIISTPAGSTGHNRSYGGPLLPHNSDNIIITPKGNTISKASKILNIHNPIKIQNYGRLNELALNSDGQQLFKTNQGTNISLTIEISKQNITLLIAKEYLNIWDSKVTQEQEFLQK